MSKNVAAVFAFSGDDRHLGPIRHWCRQIDLYPIDGACNGGLCKSGTNAARNVSNCCWRWQGLVGAIGENDTDV
jgi:hypothetical protein